MKQLKYMKSSFLKKIVCISLLLISYTHTIQAQMVGGNAPNQSAPKEVKAGELNKGAYTSDVNLFTGTMATSYDLGTVSTPSGLSFNVQLSHSSTKSVNSNPLVVMGIPYGDGWNVNVPTISVSTSAYEKYSAVDIANSLNTILSYPPRGDFSVAEFDKEGELAWFAPIISIPGVINERFIFKAYDQRWGEAVFVPAKMDKYVEARFKFGDYWKVTDHNGDVYTFNAVMTTSYRSPQNLNFTEDSMRLPPPTITCFIDSTSFDQSMSDAIIINSLVSTYQQNVSIKLRHISSTGRLVINYCVLPVGPLTAGSFAMKNNILPKQEYNTWYCEYIYNKNAPLNQQIHFTYNGFGTFDYYKELNQPMLNQQISVDYKINSQGSIPAFKFGRDIILESVSAYSDRGMIEEIDLIHHTVNPSASANMLLITDSSVQRLDSMYNSRIVYSQGVNTIQDSLLLKSNAYNYLGHGLNFNFANAGFSSWRRYLHIMSDGLSSYRYLNSVTPTGSSHCPAFGNPSNPYLFAESSSHVNPFYKYDPNVSSISGINNGDITFKHGFLESQRIQQDIIPGDIYEVRSVIRNYNMSATGNTVRACNFDVNIVSGYPVNMGGPIPPSGEITGLLPNTLLDQDFQTGIRGVKIFNTFGNPIKWTSYANTYGQTGVGLPTTDMVGVINTSNFFLMPTIPEKFNGVNIQIGAANSDIDYSLDQTQLIAHVQPYDPFGTGIVKYKRSAYTAFKKVQRNSSNGDHYVTEPSLSNPHYKPSANFGIGMPWFMLNNMYSNLSGSPDYDYANTNYDFWWKDANDVSTQDPRIIPFKNRPTMANDSISLSAMELVRYSKNPYMLVAVKKYKFNGYSTNDSISKNKYLVSYLKINYEVRVDTLYTNTYSSSTTGVKTLVSKDRVGFQNVYLLSDIKQIPVNGALGNAPSTFIEANMPTTHFKYTKLSADSIFKYVSNYDFTGNMYVMTKIVDQLGGVMQYEYYPLHDPKHTHWAVLYQDFNQLITTTPLTNPYNLPKPDVSKVQVVVKTKKYFNNTTAPLPTKIWAYDYSDNKPASYISDGTPVSLTIQTPEMFEISKYRFPNVQVDFGFKTTTVSYPSLVTTVGAVPKDVYTHYTYENRILTFGKLQKVEKYDASGLLLNKKEYIYKQSMAYANMVVTGNSTLLDISVPISNYQNWDMPEYWYNGWQSNPSQIASNATNNAILVGSFLEMPTDYHSMPFLEALRYNEIEANNHTYPHCYFVRLLKEINTDYDYMPMSKSTLLSSPVFGGTTLTDIATLSAPNQNTQTMRISGLSNPEPLSGINSMKLGLSLGPILTPTPLMIATQLQTITGYEYWDADSLGYTTSEGFKRLLNTSTDSITLSRPLIFEPSWELFRTTVTSPHLAQAYKKSEHYYYYDAKQDVSLINQNYTSPQKFDALYYSHKYGIRNLPYQTREVAKAVSHDEISKSNYYWYDTKTTTDAAFPYDTLYITGLNDTCVSATSSGTGVGNNDPYAGLDLTGCVNVPHPFATCPAGFHVTQTGVNSYMYCPDIITPLRPYNYPSDLRTKLLLRKIDEQIDTIRTELAIFNKYYPVLRFFESPILNSGGSIVDYEYIWKPNYLTKTNYQTFEHTIMGFVRREANERGLQTRYDYHPIYSTTFIDVLHPCNNGGAYDLTNQGVPQCITVGAGLADSLRTCYRYNKDFTIDSIIDPNGMVLSYKYDNFSRMRMARRNNDTLSLNAYSQWLNDTTLTFEQRSDQNYVESFILLNKGSQVAEHSRAYIDPLGRKYDVQTQVTSNYTNPLILDTLMVHSGLTIYDNWDRVVKQYKPFKFVNIGGTPVTFAPRFNAITAPYTEQQYEPNQRGHVLRAAKFGESISTGHTVNSSYNLINGYQLKVELGLSLYNFQEIAGTFLNPPLYQQRYLKTASIDEDGKKTVSYTNAFGQKVATKTYAYAIGQEVTTYVYDSQGNLKKLINPRNQITTYEYNLCGNMYRKVSVDADTVKYMFDESGHVVLEEDANARIGNYEPTNQRYMRLYTYDSFGRLIKQERANDPYHNTLKYIPDSVPFVPSYSNGGVVHYTFSYGATLFFVGGWKQYSNGGGGFQYNDVPILPINNVFPIATEKEWAYHFPANQPLTPYISHLGSATLAYLSANPANSANGQNHLKGRLSMALSYDNNGVFSNLNIYGYNAAGLMERELVQFTIPLSSTQLNSIINYPSYNLRNSLLIQQVDADADGANDMTYNYEYDGWNRLKKLYVQQGIGSSRLLAGYAYNDALGLVTKTSYYNPSVSCNPLVDQTTYTYDTRNRLTELNSLLYNEKLNYDGNTPSITNLAFAVHNDYNYNGNINGLAHSYKFNNSHVLNYAATGSVMDSATVYGYAYDGINRLSKADASVLNVLTGTSTNYTPKLNYGDETLKYDKIGNITNLTRGLYYMPTTPTPANQFQTWQYNYALNNNKLIHIDSVNNTPLRNYTYDKNGNQIAQAINGGSIYTQYMRSNLVQSQTIAPARDYVESYQYNNNDDRVYKGISSAPNTATYYLRDAGGKELATLNISSNAWIYYAYGRERVAEFGNRAVSYYNYDHLGSVRLTYSAQGNCHNLPIDYTIESANDYFSFGKMLRSFNNTGKYAYQGSEKDKELGDNDYYTHFRSLETEIARWKQVDLKMEKQMNWSPYVSMNNNPILLNDINGDIPDQFTPKQLLNAATSKNVQYHSEKADNSAKQAFNAEIGIGVGVGASIDGGKYFNVNASANVIQAKYSTNVYDKQSLTVTGPNAGFGIKLGTKKVNGSATAKVSLLSANISYDKSSGFGGYTKTLNGTVGMYGNVGSTNVGTTYSNIAITGEPTKSTNYGASLTAIVTVGASVNPTESKNTFVELYNTAKEYLKELFTSETVNTFGTNPNKSSSNYARD
jgi:RHS repeat-associated protein